MTSDRNSTLNSDPGSDVNMDLTWNSDSGSQCNVEVRQWVIIERRRVTGVTIQLGITTQCHNNYSTLNYDLGSQFNLGNNSTFNKDPGSQFNVKL